MADEENVTEEPKAKEAECPTCLPAWFNTYADMVTLLLTFFVLLLSFAKTETSKYEAALGSLREAFGGNVLMQGDVVMKGKSPDDYPTMIESQQPIKPFPVDFLTMEGILDKREINRASTEQLNKMKDDLRAYSLTAAANIFEMTEGIKVRIKDKLFFKEGSLELVDGGITIEVFDKMVKLLSKGEWVVFVEAHSAGGEVSTDRNADAFTLSSMRAAVVTRKLVERGVPANKISAVFYGDTRPFVIPGRTQEQTRHLDRRVEFLIRKIDLMHPGHKVRSE